MDHQTRQALKQDHFVDATKTGLHWAGEHRRSVITTAILLLAAIILLVGGIVTYNVRSEHAASAFGEAMQAYQTPLAQPGQPVPPGVKTYDSVTARAKAANELFSNVASKYGMTPAGRNAQYFAGLTFVEEGQNASAEDSLKKTAASWNRDIAALGKLALAQLYHQTGRDPQAIDLYNQLAAKPTETVPAGLAQLQLASLYESESKHDEARKIYAQLKDKDAKGPAGEIATQKLNPNAPQQ